VRGSILPDSWLEAHLPLLYQYLVANSSVVRFKIYGVSALGGDLQKDLKKLQDEQIPAKRIRVLDDTRALHNDLTSPIRFALGLETETVSER
jgi:hypothetical protein